MEIQELKGVALELMDALKEKGLSEVEIRLDDARITIKAQTVASVSAALSQETVHAAPTQMKAEVQRVAEPEPTGTQVRAPLVGTFYSSPTPDAPPYVLVGQRVKKGDTLFIIEAMKTMNEIEAPCDGTISRILAQPGDMVEYNQTIIVIDG